MLGNTPYFKKQGGPIGLKFCGSGLIGDQYTLNALSGHPMSSGVSNTLMLYVLTCDANLCVLDTLFMRSPEVNIKGADRVG